ncbi:MAG: hypothetical protein JWQ71_1035 [Pedosphaera sp.]|nr:hypothetical protein [Pedosphaera sp.]
MQPIRIDGSQANWQELLEETVLDGQEAALFNHTVAHHETCLRLATFMRVDLKLDDTTNTITFRRPAQ